MNYSHGLVLNPSANTESNDRKNLKSLDAYCKIAWTSSESNLHLDPLPNGIEQLIFRSEAVIGNYVQGFIRSYRKHYLQRNWRWIDLYEQGVMQKREFPADVELYKSSTFNTNCSNLLQALNRMIIQKRGTMIRNAGSNDEMVPDFIKNARLLSFDLPSWLEVKKVCVLCSVVYL